MPGPQDFRQEARAHGLLSVHHRGGGTLPVDLRGICQELLPRQKLTNREQRQLTCPEDSLIQEVPTPEVSPN